MRPSPVLTPVRELVWLCEASAVKIRAAVLEEFGAAARRAGGRAGRAEGGRGARSARGVRRLPHRPLHGLRRRSVRATRRPCSGTRARASSSGSATDVASLAPGDHVVTLFSPQCRECVHCLERADEPLPGDPRAAEQGLPARRDDAAVAGRRADPALHGHARRSPSTRSCRRSRWRRSTPRRRSSTRASSPAASRPGSARR